MKISLTRSGEEMTISFRGDITEDCEDDLQGLLQKLEVPSVVIETERIELINSLGARLWINFVQTLTKKVPTIKFRRCSPAFVDSCNTYPKFTPKNSVESLFIPASCQSCGDVDAQLIERSHFSKENPLEGVQCDKCHQRLDPSVDVDEFLQGVR